MEKTMKARVQHKHDIEANWLKATNFTPLASEIIVYDSDGNYDYPRIKIGDGKTNINDLPFVVDEAKITEIISNSLEDAKNSGEFDGKDGKDGHTPVKGTDYFTDADKQEIAEQAASMVEIPDSADYVVQDTAPTDTSVLWVDMSDNSNDGFQDAVNLALAQAKASGEFKGDKGNDGADGQQGPQGDKGDPGVYMSTEAPTDKNVQVWIDPDGNWDDVTNGIEITGASVGQTIKITEVDENGVPIAWEPVDFPSGGDTWELLARITVDEANSVNSISQLLRMPCKKVLVYYRSANDKVTTAGNWSIKAGYNGKCVEKTFSANGTWTMYQALFEIANPVVLVDNAVKNSGINGTTPATIAANGFNYVQISTVSTDAFFPKSLTNDNQVFNILGVRM